MLLDIKTIREIPGASLPFDYELDLSTLDFFGEQRLPVPVPVHGELKNRAGILELHATADVTVETVCGRCLKPLSVPLTVSFVQPLSDDLQDEENDDIVLITGDTVDADAIVTQAIIFEIDMVYLCSQECRGLCPICGADRNLTPCSCEAEGGGPCSCETDGEESGIEQ